MKKIIIVIFSLVFLSNNVVANDSRINEFTKWLLDNGHTQYLKKMNVKGATILTHELKIVLIKMVNQKNNVGWIINGEEAILNLINTI